MGARARDIHDLLVAAGHPVTLAMDHPEASWSLPEAVQKGAVALVLWPDLGSWTTLDSRLDEIKKRGLSSILVLGPIPKAPPPSPAGVRILRLEQHAFTVSWNGGKLVAAVQGKPSGGDDESRLVGKYQNATSRHGQELEAAMNSLHDGLPLAAGRASIRNAFPLPELTCHAAENFIKKQHLTLGLELLHELQLRYPRLARPRQLHALVLSRLNAPDRARFLLGVLEREGFTDGETLGMLGARFKERYFQCGHPWELHRSLKFYQRGAKLEPDNHWLLINVAALYLLSGKPKKARRGARSARNAARVDIREDFWKLATLAESYLIQGKVSKAVAGYKFACQKFPEEVGSHAVALRQARILLRCLEGQVLNTLDPSISPTPSFQGKAPSDSKKDILFITACPDDQKWAGFDLELATVVEAATASKENASPLLIEPRWDVGRAEIIDFICQFSPSVLYLSAHGSEGGLAFVGADGLSEPLAARQMTQALSGGSPPSLIVLAACNTRNMAAEIHQATQIITVGMEGKIQASVCIQFAKALFGNLRRAQHPLVACEQARRSAMDPNGDNKIHIFATRPGNTP